MGDLQSLVPFTPASEVFPKSSPLASSEPSGFINTFSLRIR